MSITPSSIKPDYTRGSPERVQLAAEGQVGARWVSGPLTTKRAAAVLLGVVLVSAALLPFDGALSAVFTDLFQHGAFWSRGDVTREMMFLQQYGAASSVVILAIAIYLLDPAVRPRQIDGGIALIANALGVWVLKMLIGRPRPHLADPLAFTPPWETYGVTVRGAVVQRHPWEFWHSLTDLWSMPSSHAAAAMALTVVLVRAYPRLAVLLYPLALLVGLCRAFVGAHYPSDVVVGWAVGYLIAAAAMDGRWGQRMLGWFGRRGQTKPSQE